MTFVEVVNANPWWANMLMGMGMGSAIFFIFNLIITGGR